MSFENFRRLRKPFTDLFGRESKIDPNKMKGSDVPVSKTVPSRPNDEHPEMIPTIYSYYADFQKNKYYENFANALIARCEIFGVPYNISKRDSRGSYGANCLMKPEFVLEKLKESKEPLIWMDCDTDFRAPFTEFNHVHEDIGMATHSGDMEGIKASPLYFNYTAGAFAIVREWVVHCRAAYSRNLPELDHDALKHYVLPHLKGKYTSFLLSSNWNDFVHGKYIFNGNSKVEGKMEVHRKMNIEDSVRASYTVNVKTMHVYFNGKDTSVFDTALNFLDRFSNYSRIFFHFPEGLKKHRTSSKYERIFIETGGNSSFTKDTFDQHKPSRNEIVFDVVNVSDIENKWDIEVIDEIMMTRNPLHSLNFVDNGKGRIRIKNHANIWA